MSSPNTSPPKANIFPIKYGCVLFVTFTIRVNQGIARHLQGILKTHDVPWKFLLDKGNYLNRSYSKGCTIPLGILRG